MCWMEGESWCSVLTSNILHGLHNPHYKYLFLSFLQVYLLSFAKEDALTQWMRKLNTAMIIGEVLIGEQSHQSRHISRLLRSRHGPC